MEQETSGNDKIVMAIFVVVCIVISGLFIVEMYNASHNGSQPQSLKSQQSNLFK